MYITKRDTCRIAAIGIAFIGFQLIGWKLFGDRILLFSLELLMLGMLSILLIFFRKIEKLQHDEHQYHRKMHYRTQGRQEHYYKHVEALLSLFCTLGIQAPLPETGGMAASPDFLRKIAEIIYQRQPELVIEASSGVSTLIAAYCLKNLGKGRIISFEQDPKYAALSQHLLAEHGLQQVATVMHTPLTEIQIHEKTWLWYDIKDVAFGKSIDMLLVDGPPAKIQQCARYPVLPLLFDQLSVDSVILLDDGKRPDEKEMVALWSQEFNNLYIEYLPLEKGAYLIQKQSIS